MPRTTTSTSTPSDGVQARVPAWRIPAPGRAKLVAGVASGIAAELGLDAIVVRIAFVVLAVAGGWGVVLYGACWLVMVVAADRREDLGPRPERGRSREHRLIGFGLVIVGLLSLARQLGGVYLDSVVWPIALFGCGLAIAYERGLGMRAGTRVADADRSGFLLRAAAGGVLVLSGVALAVSLNFDLGQARDTLLVAGVVVAGLGLVLAPWMTEVVTALGDERQARIRSDERAQVAAHLHDSVLQTLALIQKRAGDPEVVALARRQERELRGWLYERADARSSGRFRAELTAAIAGVEETYTMPVEVVVVGDIAMDEAHEALVAAACEAVVNAAKHSGADHVDVYAEVGASRSEVFVRDTGRGFDRDLVPPDRRGIADSIEGRLARVGGRVAILTGPGRGAEVELSVPSPGAS